MRVWPRPTGRPEPARHGPARRRAGRVPNVQGLPPQEPLAKAKPGWDTRKKVRNFRRDRCNFRPCAPYLKANNSFRFARRPS